MVAGSTAAQIDAAVSAAASAADGWGASSGAARAQLLRGLADALTAARETLVPLADAETALGAARLSGEIDRTSFQLRAFAALAEAGGPFALTDDAAVPGAPPAGHPRLTRVRVALGPVAMFAASNFPFAFSVLGGDTASALAAGCPVVVKAHPGHPQLSRATAALASRVIAAQGLPAGLFGLVEGAAPEVGVQLVRDPRIAGVAFTGSVRGGVALWNEANARPRPIPFYGELGSVNPVVALPSALAADGTALAATLAASITLGCGQFCTSPGIVIVRDDSASQDFVQRLAAALEPATPHPMLHPGIRAGFDAGTFVASPALHEEVFGPAALVVTVRSLDETLAVLRAVQGSLTVTLWGAGDDSADNRRLVRAAQQLAGRVLFGGVPTGVAVTAAQQHGGPWPSSTMPFSTSVGHAALDRFLRPVALQEAPAWLVDARGVA